MSESTHIYDVREALMHHFSAKNGEKLLSLLATDSKIILLTIEGCFRQCLLPVSTELLLVETQHLAAQHNILCDDVTLTKSVVREVSLSLIHI